jgi:PBP1b-binding outer membrane lipoprotein LpoB
MKNLIVITALTLALAACVNDETPERDPNEPVEIVECEPNEVCK